MCSVYPFCVSVRPHARGESFTFGKGLRPVEAEVGAYMEALEFFYGRTREWPSLNSVGKCEGRFRGRANERCDS